MASIAQQSVVPVLTLIVSAIGASVVIKTFWEMLHEHRCNKVFGALSHHGGTASFAELLLASKLREKVLRKTLEKMLRNGELSTWIDQQSHNEMWTRSYRQDVLGSGRGRFQSRF